MNAVNPPAQSENSVEGSWTGSHEKNPLMTQTIDPVPSLALIMVPVMSTYGEANGDIVRHIPDWISQKHLRNLT